PIADAVRWTFQSVGATGSPGDIQVTLEGPVVTITCEGRKNQIVTGAWTPEQAARTALFLACPASRPIDGHTFGAAVPSTARATVPSPSMGEGQGEGDGEEGTPGKPELN